VGSGNTLFTPDDYECFLPKQATGSVRCFGLPGKAEPFHEPEGRARQSPARRLRIAKLRRARSDARYRFKAPMHDRIDVRALHEPVGAGDKPTPDPSQEGNWPSRPAPLLGGVGGGFVVPMHFKRKWGLSMNRRFGVPALAGPGRLKAGHQTSFAAQSGSRSQCTAQKSRGLSMNRTVTQAASLLYRRLPVGGAWNNTQAPHPASGQQVGKLRNSRLGSLRYYPIAVHGPNACGKKPKKGLSKDVASRRPTRNGCSRPSIAAPTCGRFRERAWACSSFGAA